MGDEGGGLQGYFEFSARFELLLSMMCAILSSRTN